ncbi:MAG: hypothetical protein KDA72_00320 [Planctomycetales bacterium]|nr:hypothetical protein [Planctomycetales bacterium]
MTEYQYALSNPWTRRLLILLAIAVLGSLAAWWFAPQPFFMAWLAACMLPWSISVGSLTLMLIVCLTGGRWGTAAWPWLAINARLMPLVAILFIPWMFGISIIYPWANSDILTQFENTENRQWLFQVPFTIGRTVFYFAVWTGLAWFATGGASIKQLVADLPQSYEKAGEKRKIATPPEAGKSTAVAGLGLIAILLTVTWSGIDWVMSFDPFFTSTLFGALIGVGAMLAAMSAAVAAVCFWKPLQAASVDDRAIADLSNLLLTFLMLWAYFSFAHFLIMWSGDLPEEAAFYVARKSGLWGWIAPILSMGGFLVPFMCLFSRNFKSDPTKVGTLAVSLLLVRVVELWWMVLPAARGSNATGLPWATLPATLAVAAIYVLSLWWMMTRARQLLDKARPQEIPHD